LREPLCNSYNRFKEEEVSILVWNKAEKDEKRGYLFLV